jgi:aminopeptidase
MGDPRIDKLAKVLINYSLGVKKDDLLLINSPVVAAPLIRALVREALISGTHPYLRLDLEGVDEIFYKYASEEQLRYVSPMTKMEVDEIDCMITVWGETNTRRLTNIPPEKMKIARLAKKDIFQRMLERIAEGSLSWCGTLFPTEAHAQDAEMSLMEYEDFVYNAGFLNEEDPVSIWRDISKKQAEIAKFLEGKRTFRIVGDGTDLTLSTEGRRWINADGHENFPDGEVFTSPVEDSVNGYIRFTYPAIITGKEVNGIFLKFEEGKVVEASAEKGDQFLKAMVKTDEGAGRVGEFAFGTNPHIQKYTKNTLFDEKIGGTIHIALGASIKEAGGKNISAIHWDLVLDLRNGGEIYADGELIYKDGEFVHPEIPKIRG